MISMCANLETIVAAGVLAILSAAIGSLVTAHVLTRRD